MKNYNSILEHWVAYLTAITVSCRVSAPPSPFRASPFDIGILDCSVPTGGLFHSIRSISLRSAVCEPCFRPSIVDRETLNTSLHSILENAVFQSKELP